VRIRGRSLAPARGAFALATLVSALFVTAVPALAHAVLLASDPAAGARIEHAPHAVTLTFDEHVETSLGSLRVLDAGGTAHSSGPVIHPDGDATRVAVGLENMTIGRYVVAWQVVSADSHVVSGAYAFGVGVPAGNPPAPVADNGAALFIPILHFFILAGVLLGIGLPIGAAAIARTTRRTPNFVEFGAWIVLAFAAFADLAFRADLTGGTLAGAIATRIGVLRLVTIGAALAGVLSLIGKQRRWALLAVASLTAAVSLALAGHAADGAQWPIGVAADVLHLLAAASWIGVLAIGTTLAAGPELRGISPVAASAVAMLVITGIVQTIRNAGSLDALLTTTYGRTIDLKIALLVVLLVLALNARRALARGVFTIAGGIKAELWLLTAVIAVTAVLVESPLPRDAAVERTVSATMPLHGFNVHVIATAIDDRHWSVRIQDLDSLDAAGVSVSEASRHVGPLAVPVTRQGPGTFAGTIALPFAGAWTLLASVRSGPFDEAHTTLTLPETSP
jgi:copper transport protein